MFKCDLCGCNEIIEGSTCRDCGQPYEINIGPRIKLSPGQIMALKCAPRLPAGWIKDRMCEHFKSGILAAETAIMLLGQMDSADDRDAVVKLGKQAIEMMRKDIEKVATILSDEVIERMHRMVEVDDDGTT